MVGATLSAQNIDEQRAILQSQLDSLQAKYDSLNSIRDKQKKQVEEIRNELKGYTSKASAKPKTAKLPSMSKHATMSAALPVADNGPVAALAGRSVAGNLPKPAVSAQKKGSVVVEITVDQNGSVKQAVAGAQGTTVSDQALWAVARAAALQAHFNKSASAPMLQKGTITYIFK